MHLSWRRELVESSSLGLREVVRYFLVVPWVLNLEPSSFYFKKNSALFILFLFKNLQKLRS